MYILRNQILMYSNVLSYTAKVRKDDICALLEQIRRKTEVSGYKICGRIISTEKKENNEFNEFNDGVIEVELLVPIDRHSESTAEYKYKSQFKLLNAVKVRYEGDICEIRKGVLLLDEYLNENNLEPITGCYFSYIQAYADSPESVIADIYVGINTNVL
ncbi:MAG: hypothetical protein FWG70_09715 [Oscillospiraceae bacterium]|nr:hypothetical protein [Oscillospiraceae bacterium]